MRKYILPVSVSAALGYMFGYRSGASFVLDQVNEMIDRVLEEYK